MVKLQSRLLALKVLLVIGMLISLFLVYEHFSPSASRFCDLGEGFDCGIVNKSPYANLDGISYMLTIDWGLPLPLVDLSGANAILDFLTTNAFLGFLTLAFVFLLARSYGKKTSFFWIPERQLTYWIRYVLLFGIAYGAFLFYVQHSLLRTYCIFCLSLDGVLLLSGLLAWRIGK